MSGFMVDDVGPHGLACLFEDEGETGYFYLYEENGRGVLDDLHIYTRSASVNVNEDVEVLWSSDGNKCGVVIWNGMRGIFDIHHRRKTAAKLESRDTPPIADPKWLKDFDF